jgi:hypothetical protein
MTRLFLLHSLIYSRLTDFPKLGFSIFLGSAVIGATSTAATPPGQAILEEVLVTGERPGPEMWRVSKGSHDLWILATLDPLPKKMFWRSRLVEKRISSSQLVLAPPDVMVDIHFFGNPAYQDALVRAPIAGAGWMVGGNYAPGVIQSKTPNSNGRQRML